MMLVGIRMIFKHKETILIAADTSITPALGSGTLLRSDSTMLESCGWVIQA